MFNFIPLRLLMAAELLTRSAPRPSFLTADGRFDLKALMRFAHSEASANIDRTACHAAIIADHTAALMIDSDRRMVAAIDACAAGMAVRL